MILHCENRKITPSQNEFSYSILSNANTVRQAEIQVVILFSSFMDDAEIESPAAAISMV